MSVCVCVCVLEREIPSRNLGYGPPFTPKINPRVSKLAFPCDATITRRSLDICSDRQRQSM